MVLKYITTTFEGQLENCKEGRCTFAPDEGEENELLNLYPQMTYQTWEGFGGALTDSAGFIYKQLNSEQKKELMQSYFETTQMSYQMVRIPIDSCDFSTSHYEADGDETDSQLEHFNMERVEQVILPLLDAAQQVHGAKLPIMLTPWSPPSYMKSNKERNHGGSLLPKYRTRWADYICRYIKEYQKRGYNIKRISLQNEPKAVQTWDSCIYDAQQEKEFLRDYMWPALQKNGLGEIEIFIWDHNKERAFERACTIIDEDTDQMVAGIAFHWYSGDHFDALRMIHEKFPSKKLILSEACIEYSKFSCDDYLANAQKYAHDIIGNINEGMSGFYDWNIVLDEIGGPNHVGNFCDAPYLFNTKTKELIKRNTARYLWHFSHFIQPGAVRIGCSKYSDKLEVTAVKNPDGQIATVLLNQTKKEIPVNIRITDQMVLLHLPPMSITSATLLQNHLV